MWNEKAPLELLKSMPTELSEGNLIAIQKEIDVDKYVNSFGLDYDLCGTYAPFCNRCDKSLHFPCAVAYIRMKQSEGMDVVIPEEIVASEEEKSATEEQVEEIEEAEEAEVAMTEEVVEDASSVEPEEKVFKRIRIAIARRRS